MSAERARLFVGLELPATAGQALVRWRMNQLHQLAGARLVEPEALHVTLCFLGQQEVAEVDRIAGACLGVRVLREPELAIGAPVWLPARHPRVIAVELRDSHNALSEIHATLSQALHGGGWYQPESRPFYPHVTIARIGKHERVARVALPAPSPLAFRGSMITLFRSRPGAGGASYEPLSRLALGTG
jgi:RNA 2',3'-cyclic 3'-phosphodiesterase